MGCPRVVSLIEREWNGSVRKLSSQARKFFFFVHIRRSDFSTWPNLEHPLVLDAQWDIKGMDHFRERVRNPIFLILTDYPDHARRYVGDQPNVFLRTISSLI